MKKATKKFRIITQYIKDLSFENKLAIDYKASNVKPEPNFNLDIKTASLGNSIYEVSLVCNVDAKLKNKMNNKKEKQKNIFQKILEILKTMASKPSGLIGLTILVFHVVLAITSPLYVPCLLYTSPSPRDRTRSRMPSSA